MAARIAAKSKKRKSSMIFFKPTSHSRDKRKHLTRKLPKSRRTVADHLRAVISSFVGSRRRRHRRSVPSVDVGRGPVRPEAVQRQETGQARAHQRNEAREKISG